MTASRRTSGSGRRKTCIKAKLRRFTRTSLYSRRRAAEGRDAALLPCGRARPDMAVAIGEVGLVPQGALPLAGLVEEVAPGDRAVLRRLERNVARIVAHRIVDRADEAARDR